jgi:hypothetical protein
MSDENIDLEAMGMLSEAPPSEEDKAHAEYLNSPMGRIEQAMAALMFATETFSARIAQCERHLAYLLSKDPVVGPKMREMAEAAKAGAGDDGAKEE